MHNMLILYPLCTANTLRPSLQGSCLACTLQAFDTAEAGPPEEPATVPGPAQADGDETDAEDVEQALAALESIVVSHIRPS